MYESKFAKSYDNRLRTTAFVDVDVTDLSVRSYENFALVITRFNYAMTAEGKPLPPPSIRAMIVLKKEKNEWKIASAQYTGIRPPATQPRSN